MQDLDVSAIFQPQYLTIFHLLDNLFNIFFSANFSNLSPAAIKAGSF